MAQLKGTAVQSSLRCLVGRLGEEALTRIPEALPPEDLARGAGGVGLSAA